MKIFNSPVRTNSSPNTLSNPHIPLHKRTPRIKSTNPQTTNQVLLAPHQQHVADFLDEPEETTFAVDLLLLFRLAINHTPPFT